MNTYLEQYGCVIMLLNYENGENSYRTMSAYEYKIFNLSKWTT